MSVELPHFIEQISAEKQLIGNFILRHLFRSSNYKVLPENHLKHKLLEMTLLKWYTGLHREYWNS